MNIWVLCVGLLAILSYPFLIETLRPRMTANRRKFAPGAFADLSQGRTHYRWLGAEDGPIAVCVHGLTTPSYVYGPLAERLGAQGYRVLIYDLYGRGFSDRPSGEQDSAFFIQQLNDLLDDQGVEEPFNLIGYSMGGAIGAAYTAEHPERVNQLILLASAGMAHDLGPLAEMTLKYDFFGKWLTLGFYAKSLRRGLETERGLKSEVPNMVDLQIAETRLHGFSPAVLSSLRGVLDEDLEPAHRKIAEAGLPVMAIWGQEDDVIPLSCKDTLAGWNPQARQEIVPEAGHAVTYTHTDAVFAHMQDSL